MYTSFSVISVLVFTLTNLAIPLIIRFAIDNGMAKGSGAVLTWCIAAFFAVVLVNYGASYLQESVVGKVAEHVLFDIRRAMMERLQRVSLGWMDRTEVTNGQFARFVEATSYVTVAEKKPDPANYPGVPAEKLVAGFDAVVLQAGSANALVSWLNEHGYAFSPEVEAWAKPYVIAGAAVAVVVAVGLGYLLGRRRGRKRSTVVEIRRV